MTTQQASWLAVLPPRATIIAARRKKINTGALVKARHTTLASPPTTLLSSSCRKLSPYTKRARKIAATERDRRNPSSLVNPTPSTLVNRATRLSRQKERKPRNWNAKTNAVALVARPLQRKTWPLRRRGTIRRRATPSLASNIPRGLIACVRRTRTVLPFAINPSLRYRIPPKLQW